MFLSELLILSIDGSCLLTKKFRHNLNGGSHEAFLTKIQECQSTDLEPHFRIGDLFCFNIRRSGLYFCAVSTDNISTLLAFDILNRMYSLIKDFCGIVNEQYIRANIILVYEVLEEFMDFGYVQLSATDKLKPYILNEPAVVRSPENQTSGLFGIEHRLAPSNAADKPVIRSRTDQEQRKSQVFLNIIERLSVLIAPNGTALRSELHGQMNLKCFLVDCPEVRIGLNKDLVIGNQLKDVKVYGGVVHLDQCTFHDSVNLEKFSSHKVLKIHPPEGEICMLSYHMEGDLPHGLPFRVYSYVKDDPNSLRDLELTLKLRCEIPSARCQAVNITMHIPVPKTTTSISQQLSSSDQKAEFVNGQKKIEWKLKKIFGKMEQTAQFKLIGAKESKRYQTEIGPVAMEFEISGYVCSSLQIQFLQLFDKEERSYYPEKWVRYITTADSYMVKLS